MCEDSIHILRKEFDQVSLELIIFCKNSFVNETVVLESIFLIFLLQRQW